MLEQNPISRISFPLKHVDARVLLRYLYTCTYIMFFLFLYSPVNYMVMEEMHTAEQKFLATSMTLVF